MGSCLFCNKKIYPIKQTDKDEIDKEEINKESPSELYTIFSENTNELIKQIKNENNKNKIKLKRNIIEGLKNTNFFEYKWENNQIIFQYNNVINFKYYFNTICRSYDIDPHELFDKDYFFLMLYKKF